MSCCWNDKGEKLDLELDPLVLRGDAGDPVDVRLQQAHRALEKGGQDEPQRVKTSVMKKLDQIWMNIMARQDRWSNHLRRQEGRLWSQGRHGEWQLLSSSSSLFASSHFAGFFATESLGFQLKVFVLFVCTVFVIDFLIFLQQTNKIYFSEVLPTIGNLTRQWLWWTMVRNDDDLVWVWINVWFVVSPDSNFISTIVPHFCWLLPGSQWIYSNCAN